MSNLSIAARVDRLPIGAIHRKAAFIIGLGLFFELYDVYLSGVLGSVISDQFHISGSTQSLLLGSSFLGMFLGAIFLNRMADLIGRRKAFMVNLLIYSVFTFLCAFSPSVVLLVLFRFLAGVGIGAEAPLGDTYLSEVLPTYRRGKLMVWAYTLQFCSMPVEGLLARWIVPTQFGMAGWRWMFIIGSLGAVFAWALQQFLPESPRWLESVGRKPEAEEIMMRFERHVDRSEEEILTSAMPTVPDPPQEKLPVSTLFVAQFRKRTILLWVFQILQTFGYYGFGTLVPLVLAAKGFDVHSSLTYTTLSFIGYPVGSLISLPIVERIQRKWLIVMAAFCMALFGILFGISNSIVLIIIFGFLYTMVSNIFSNAYHIFQVEIYPTSIRATASGAGYSLSRLSSGLMPFVLLPLLQGSGATAMFSVVAIAMVIVMIDIGGFAPKTTARVLEELNEVPSGLATSAENHSITP
ncbi:MFS transporter [Alicyclobacillus suci]|uniref:MFS transporter n=1 Tax=Alicyclobacillus suci TaxID=2816080 RepID=UPI001A8D91F0|nr:MFS transporter [Alicyclobacillus suci]